MKTLISVILSFFCLLCKGQTIEPKAKYNNSSQVKPIDTVSTLLMRNKQYGSFSYKVLQLELSDTDKSGDRIKKIVVNQNNKTIGFILLPNSVDVKNFGVTKIEETKEGFKIAINWGGGNYIYDIVYYFSYKGGKFYLYAVETNSYGPDTGVVKTAKKISPPLPINKFDISNYLYGE